MPSASQSLALALVDRGVTKKPSNSTPADACDSIPESSDGGHIASGAPEDEQDMEDIGIGEVFGAISVLQAVGETILGVRSFFKLPFRQVGGANNDLISFGTASPYGRSLRADCWFLSTIDISYWCDLIVRCLCVFMLRESRCQVADPKRRIVRDIAWTGDCASRGRIIR